MTANNKSSLVYEAASRHYIWPQLSKEEIARGVPVVLSGGEGVRVRTVDGDQYLDLMSTTARVSTLGYGNERMVDAVASQLRTLHYGGTAKFQADVTIELAERLAGLAPGELSATYFVGSGSEANEAAIKLAHFYQRSAGAKPRAYKVISRWNAYHGSAGGAMGASDWLGVRHPSEPGYPGYSRVPAPTCYRFPIGSTEAEYADICADMLEQQIIHEGPELVSAVIAEPIMQANGVQIPADGYLQRVREICDRHGVLMIADEVISCFGRTGELFALNHWRVEPDIMTMSKALTAGYMPLGATMVTSRIHEAVDGFPDIHTYGGHPGSAVASMTMIDIVEEEDLVARSASLGRTALRLLSGCEELEIVGQIRGRGLWVAVDFTSDPQSRALPEPTMLENIVQRTRDLGALVSQNGTAIEIAPPLVITEADLETGIAMFRQAIEEANKQRASYPAAGGAVE